MSLDIYTESPGVVINSLVLPSLDVCLTLKRDGRVEHQEDFSSRLYRLMLKNIWSDYISSQGVMPSLLGHDIGKVGLTSETLHYIANDQFFFGSCRLSPDQESMLNWIRAINEDVATKLGEPDFTDFNGSLDRISKHHYGLLAQR